MHMADALISPSVAAVGFVLSGAAAAYSIKKVKEDNRPELIPIMGIMGAFVFAVQMLNFTIPGTGSSGHLCGGMLLSALLGPYGAFLTMIGVLLIQGLLFADGGLLALGCNVWNMAFYGCFIGGLLIWRPLQKSGLSPARITMASIIGSVLTLQLGAFSVVLETLASGITELPFATFAGLMQSIHLAIGVGEGLITAAVLCFVYEVRPQLLEGSSSVGYSFKKLVAVFAVLTAIAAGGMSLYASENPDGLEWAMGNILGSEELEGSGSAHEEAAALQEKTSIMPDYAFKDSESPLGTTTAGLLGSAIVFALCYGSCRALKLYKRNA